MRRNKNIAQQNKYYEVEYFYSYLATVYINGNHESYKKLFKELDKESKQDFIEYLFISSWNKDDVLKMIQIII